MRRRILVGLGLVLLAVLAAWQARRGATVAVRPVASRPSVAASPQRAERAPLRLSGAEATQAGAGASAFELEGRVLSTANGAGVAGAVLVLGLGEGVHETRADEDGRFRWSTEVAGTYQLTSLEAPGFVSFAPELGQSPIVFQARAGVRLRDVTLYLSPIVATAGDGGAVADRTARVVDAGRAGKGRIVGAVREADSGKPVAAFSIVARLRKGAIERGDDRQGSYFDSEGRYLLEGLVPGTQCLTALALGRAASTEQCIEVSADGETHLDFSLGRGARLTGRVIDRQARTPIAKARVSLEQPFGLGEDSPLPVIASTETDAEGQFVLEGLDTGVRSIFVTAAGHHSRVLPGLQLDADRPPPPIEVDLLATAPGEEARIESAGINAAVRAEGDTLVIDRVSPGGGAEEAGLLAGDVVLRVDGVELSTLGMQAGVERMRGPEGSTVVLAIRRPPDKTVRDVRVTRRRIVNR